MTDHIEIRPGIFVDAATATVVEHKSAAILAAQRFERRSRMPRPPQAAPTTPGELSAFAKELNATSQRMFGRDALHLTVTQLQVLEDVFARQERRAREDSAAITAELQERGANVVAFPTVERGGHR